MATVKFSKTNNESANKSKKKLKLEWVRNPMIFAAVLQVFKKKDTVGPSDVTLETEDALVQDVIYPNKKLRVRNI